MMREKIKKIAGWCPGPALIAWAAALALMLLLAPLLRLAEYSVPWYDDYNYGGFVKRAISESPTVRNALAGAWECARSSWYAWQGTYMSIVFMALMPGAWGEAYYRWGPVFLICILALSTCVLVGTLLRDVLRADWRHTVIIAASAASITLVLIHTAQAGFYWYNAGVHYVGMHSFGMLLVAAAIRLLHAEKVWQRVLLAVLGAILATMVAGANFVTALQGLLTLLTVAVLGWIVYRKRIFWLLPAFCVYILGFCQNVMAPGNDKRADNYIGWGMSPIKAVLYSFVEGFKHIWEFTGWMTLAIFLLMLPIIWHMLKTVDFSFRLPGLLSLWSLCLYATGFTPSLYSLGHAGLSRTLNAVKITYQILLVLNVVYWSGWFYARLKKRGKEPACRMWRWWHYPLLGLLMLLIFHFESNQAGSFSSYGAFYYVHTGEAYNFYQEYLERVALFQGEESVVVVKPYQWRPWFLCIGDLSDDPENESNRAVADWYHKAKVICQE